MGIIKRCELCVSFFDCDIHDKVCDNLKFLQNFLDIEESEDIAKYCKSHVGYPKSDLRRLKKRLKKAIFTDLETGKDISELIEFSFLGLETPKVDSIVKYGKEGIKQKRIENTKNLICRCGEKIELTVPMYVDEDDLYVCKTCFEKLKGRLEQKKVKRIQIVIDPDGDSVFSSRIDAINRKEKIEELIHRKIDSNWKPEPIEIIKMNENIRLANDYENLSPEDKRLVNDSIINEKIMRAEYISKKAKHIEIIKKKGSEVEK